MASGLSASQRRAERMLQKLNFEADNLEEADRGHLLRPAFYWEVAKRRWLHFLLPFILVAVTGAAVVLLWPAIYLAEGKILVQSQQIPTELVRPTVTSAAQERIEVIQQRTMTRDNLAAIADKFHLFPDKRDLMSVTELVDAVKKATKIAPVDPTLDFRQRSQNPTVVFSVGFEYRDPQIAAQVANELVTQILNEDLRDRTSRAIDTTRFLSREVERLQAENATLDDKIARLRISEGKLSVGTADQPTTALAQLKAELAQKSALYAPRHPTIQSLTKQIEALERTVAAPAKKTEATGLASLEALTAQQESLQKNLEAASSKLAAARLGENLEKDQRSEKLEVLEQPAVPQRPVRPNRPKLAALSLLAAAAAGLGLAFLTEMMDKSIRRSSDIFALVDPRLVVSIPYIATAAELRGRKRRWVILLGFIAASVIAAVIAGYLLLPVDLIIARARVGLFR